MANRGIPLFCFEVAVVGALDGARFHEHLRRRAVDALLEACIAVSLRCGNGGGAWVVPVQDMAVVVVVVDT
jgi:hypothetical protein